MRRRRGDGGLRSLLGPAVFAAALLCFFTALSNLEQGRDAEALGQLEDAIRRSAVACYAAEGVYPPDLAYLEARYGLQIDRDHYTVYYNVFASNLMPEISVLENEGA